MSTIAPHIQQFAEQYAESIYPYAEMPFSHSDAVRTAAAAIEAWESNKPSKSAFTKMWNADNTRAVPIPHGQRLLWLMSDGSYFTGEYATAFLASNGTVTTEAYASLPYDSEVL